jgi:hypothetical protein
MLYKAKAKALQLFEMCESIHATFGDAYYDIGAAEGAGFGQGRGILVNEYFDEMRHQITGLRTSHDDVWQSELWSNEYDPETGDLDTPPIKGTRQHEQQSESWDTFLDEAEATHKWFAQVAKIMELQISIPETIYG